MKALEPEEFDREVVGTIRETQFLACNEGWYGGYYRTINTHVLGMVRYTRWETKRGQPLRHLRIVPRSASFTEREAPGT